MNPDNLDNIDWIRDFLVVDIKDRVPGVVSQLKKTDRAWVVFRDEDEEKFFACPTVFAVNGLEDFGADQETTIVLRDVLQFDPHVQSVVVETKHELPDVGKRYLPPIGPVAPYVLVEGKRVAAIGVPQRELGGSRIAEGTIKRLQEDKGFGFIEVGTGQDLFFHSSSVEGIHFEDLREGQRVCFTKGGNGSKGPRAEAVTDFELLRRGTFDVGDTAEEGQASSAPPDVESAQPRATSGPAEIAPPEASDGSAESEPEADAGPDESASPDDDEGTRPVRYPSIGVDQPLSPAKRCTFSVDLQLKPDDDKPTDALNFEVEDENWQSYELTTHLFCPLIDFDDDGHGCVTIRRNDASIPATISGVVASELDQDVTVVASFFDGTRYCGNAQRTFKATSAPDAEAAPSVASEEETFASETRGGVSVELDAQHPDVTVYITQDKTVTPVRLQWRLITKDRFNGLPPKLSGYTELGQDPESEAKTLFKRFARLEEGKHVESIQGFGSELWQRTPEFFRKSYWALCDHYQLPLTIQFITDEPFLPWELMRPSREDESEAEIHPPLAFAHNVARWIEGLEGYMPNSLPNGHICTIAPNYPVASRRLPRSVKESESLVEDYAARPVAGTRVAVLNLLKGPEPGNHVALLHFAGHGSFDVDAASQSTISLEDGTLSASEVGRPEVSLGKRCRTLVFFNACQVGSAGSILGEVGGWAQAFLSRRFGGFIAPLWSVEDQDAHEVARALVHGVFEEREPIANVLRSIRQEHGDISPTFYSYLYYGDVTARINS